MADDLVISTSQFSSNVNESQFIRPSETLLNSDVHMRDVITFYELEKCVHCIKKYKIERPKVALQFPDSQLCDSATVAQIIEEQANCKTYILADTSYGSCCLDEIAAEHIKADLTIHFGPACLSQTQRIPVLYVFGKERIDIEHCCQSFKDFFPDKNCKILLIYDVVYHHAIDCINSRLAKEYESLVLSTLNCTDDFVRQTQHATSENGNQNKHSSANFCGKEVSEGDIDDKLYKMSLKDNCDTNTSYSRFGRSFKLRDNSSIEDYTVFYIGKESLTLTNHMMAYNQCQFYSYNPETSICRKETLNVNRLLMKRYYLIERAKDAQIIGILIGTLGVANYLAILDRIKKILRQSGKKYYTFVVGKLNPEKLANFMEIDMFVLIACPENSLISSQDFYKPIINPFEIEIACTKARDWTGEYITDFQELLPGAAHYVDLGRRENEETDIPDVSLISGQLRPVYLQEENVESQSDGLVLRNQNTVLSTQHHTNAAEFLSLRTWKGLEPKRGETEVTKAVEGRSGIASGYTHEPASD